MKCMKMLIGSIIPIITSQTGLASVNKDGRFIQVAKWEKSTNAHDDALLMIGQINFLLTECSSVRGALLGVCGPMQQ